MYRLISLIIGVLTAVMIALNGALASRLGNATASIIIHLTGLALITLLVLPAHMRTGPRRALTPLHLGGGVLGFLTVVLANSGVMELGISLVLGLGLLGQTISAMMIDTFGWLGAQAMPFDRRKLGSVLLIIAGIAVMAYLG